MNPNSLQALQYLLALLDTLASAGMHVKNLAAHLSQAQAQNRDLTDEEVASFKTAAEDARAKLAAVIQSLDAPGEPAPTLPENEPLTLPEGESLGV